MWRTLYFKRLIFFVKNAFFFLAMIISNMISQVPCWSELPFAFITIKNFLLVSFVCLKFKWFLRLSLLFAWNEHCMQFHCDTSVCSYIEWKSKSVSFVNVFPHLLHIFLTSSCFFKCRSKLTLVFSLSPQTWQEKNCSGWAWGPVLLKPLSFPFINYLSESSSISSSIS